MKTVNSISGGKTSAYLACHYPADVEIFAVCCIDEPVKPQRIDPGVMREAKDRLAKYTPQWGEFRATSEDPATLKAVLDLEQMIRREIVWVRGMGWEQMIRSRGGAVPNQMKRFCTSIMKMQPIFEHLFLYHGLPVKMRIGFRWDEMERAERAASNTMFKYATHCNNYGSKHHRWQEIEWRKLAFPLIENPTTYKHVRDFWAHKPIVWPEDSNCQNCFWKSYQQLRRNYDTNPEVMEWAESIEEQFGYTFKNRPLSVVKNDGLQMDFEFGGGSGCQAGFCTD